MLPPALPARPARPPAPHARLCHIRPVFPQVPADAHRALQGLVDASLRDQLLGAVPAVSAVAHTLVRHERERRAAPRPPLLRGPAAAFAFEQGAGAGCASAGWPAGVVAHGQSLAVLAAALLLPHRLHATLQRASTLQHLRRLLLLVPRPCDR
jgi:hypothetical protein